jgi:hypothetical protein
MILDRREEAGKRGIQKESCETQKDLADLARIIKGDKDNPDNGPEGQ